MQSQWTAVDNYLDQIYVHDAMMESVLARCHEKKLPPISVAPTQGKLLMLLVQMQGAKRILEIGTLGGYSTIWLARGLLPGGTVTTLELDPHHAAVARQNFAAAGVADRVHLRPGRAIETLALLDHNDPFDFVFIDADKASTTDYFQAALKLTRSGSVIVVDNVVRDGEIINPRSDDRGVAGVRRFNEVLRDTPGVTATAIQTVSVKGYDGFALLRVD